MNVYEIAADGNNGSDAGNAEYIYTTWIEQPCGKHSAASAERRLHSLEVHPALIVKILVEYVDCHMRQQRAYKSQPEIQSIYVI